jgi:hypothetical protein
MTIWSRRRRLGGHAASISEEMSEIPRRDHLESEEQTLWKGPREVNCPSPRNRLLNRDVILRKNVVDLTFSLGFNSKRRPDEWICCDFYELRVRPTHDTLWAISHRGLLTVTVMRKAGRRLTDKQMKMFSLHHTRTRIQPRLLSRSRWRGVALDRLGSTNTCPLMPICS